MATQIASKYSRKTDLFLPNLDKVNLIWMMENTTGKHNGFAAELVLVSVSRKAT